MSFYYVIFIFTLFVCITIHDAAPWSRDTPHDLAMADKRGGIPNRFRGNDFHHSLHPIIQQRAVKTPTSDDVTEEKMEEENPQKGRRLVSRDYLFTVLGMGSRRQREPYRFNHDKYNNYYYYYYYDNDNGRDDDYIYDYYDYYDYGEDDEDDGLSEPVEEDGGIGRRKTRTGDSGGRTPTLKENQMKNQLATRNESKRRTPTVRSSKNSRRLSSRDYLGILGMGAGQGSSSHHFDHNHYNSHYYYDDDYDDNDYDYYFYDYYDDDDYYRKRGVDQEKMRTAAVKRKTPTSTDSDVESQLETLKDSQGKSPTAEGRRFLQAIKRYMESSRFSNDVIRK